MTLKSNAYIITVTNYSAKVYWSPYTSIYLQKMRIISINSQVYESNGSQKNENFHPTTIAATSFLKFQSTQHLQSCHSPGMCLLHMPPANKVRFPSRRINTHILHSQHLENFRCFIQTFFYTCKQNQRCYSQNTSKFTSLEICTKRWEAGIWYDKLLTKETGNETQVGDLGKQVLNKHY